MTLTAKEKFAIVAAAFVVNMLLLIWTGIKVDVLALGMRTEVFNIGLTIFTILNTGVTAVLVYLGIRAPTIGQTVIDTPAPEPPTA